MKPKTNRIRIECMWIPLDGDLAWYGTHVKLILHTNVKSSFQFQANNH